ncbi:MAG TPA: SET domain-containing protein-lysine N-methyltransferase [Micavibrio sp.]|nr:SET domain-containing protein-lysine N-methyltransferase [Micavibrio sp.]
MTVYDMHHRVELRARPDGSQGVFSARNFKAGDVLSVGYIGKIVKSNERNAVQIGKDQFVILAGLINCVNHSCSPNCGVRPNLNRGFDLVAMHDGGRNDEVTYDYATQNYLLEYMPDRCTCGSPECRGKITGWCDLSRDKKTGYKKFVAPYLIEIDEDGVFTRADLTQ